MKSKLNVGLPVALHHVVGWTRVPRTMYVCIVHLDASACCAEMRGVWRRGHPGAGPVGGSGAAQAPSPAPVLGRERLKDVLPPPVYPVRRETQQNRTSSWKFNLKEVRHAFSKTTDHERRGPLEIQHVYRVAMACLATSRRAPDTRRTRLCTSRTLPRTFSARSHTDVAPATRLPRKGGNAPVPAPPLLLLSRHLPVSLPQSPRLELRT
mmetsp:Transcript_31638/g.100472  ORF Transcript_31638/g.100472 Transcript_31638/m.100472 type:complete len:209 (-) Transcript_31638:532-1158(-)